MSAGAGPVVPPQPEPAGSPAAPALSPTPQPALAADAQRTVVNLARADFGAANAAARG